MKRSPDYLIRQVAGRYVLAPMGEAAKHFSGMITMNETGKFLWELLEQEQTMESLTKALSETYGVAPEQAAADIDAYLNPLKPIGAVID